MKPVLYLAGLLVFAVAPPQRATALTLAPELVQQTGDTAVRLRVAIHLLDVLRIDDADQTAFVDFALWVSWQDESLANPGAPARFFRTNQIWVPNLQIMNSLTLTNRRVDVVEVDENGNANYRRRLVGTISIPRDLSDFPVDEHELRLAVVAAGMTRDVGLVIDERLTGQSDTFSIQEWDVGSGKAEISEFVAAGESFPMLVYEWEVRRKIGYYIWKVILPLAMVVMMSWVVFWLDPKQAGPQIGIAATSILTLIAYRFTLGFLVPRLSYLTRLDLFITGASVLVFVALVEALATVSMAEDRPALARRIDVTSRWLFPVAFAAVTVVSFWL
ncbi:MAG: hypothetical protein JSU87_14945 [Gemmatimonadota bacterium]|nr:MAG: hypothetical protein JSU87_14945 [Gemmatimonadota bacterium]